MSRYLAFVLLALSATSVLAAPAELPAVTVPDLSAITEPIVGRSNNKVYSPNTLHKRDWEYPSSTKDCRISEVPEDSTTLSYTHDGVEYSEECLTRLALSVPFEDRKSCRTTGHEARGYDEECLFKKAFDEDWKFDLEKEKEEELAWRAAHPSVPSSDHWRTHYPESVGDCKFKLEIEGELKIEDGDKEKDEKEKGKRAGEEKEVKGKKKDATKTSEALDGWKPYSVAPNGDKFDNECIVRLVIRLKIVIDIGKCHKSDEKSDKSDYESKSDGLSDFGKLPSFDDKSDDKTKTDGLSDFGKLPKLPILHERSTTELATRADSKESIDIGLSALVALRLGCILGIVLKIALKVGIHTKLLGGPLTTVVGLAGGILAAVLRLL